jgi:hypothetical protein
MRFAVPVALLGLTAHAAAQEPYYQRRSADRSLGRRHAMPEPDLDPHPILARDPYADADPDAEPFLGLLAGLGKFAVKGFGKLIHKHHKHQQNRRSLGLEPLSRREADALAEAYADAYADAYAAAYAKAAADPGLE